MSFELAFRSRVASIMETLTATALQDICQLMGETYAALRVEMVHEQNQSSRTKLQAMENGTGVENPANCMERIHKLSLRNFPVVEQILNEQEANGLWLEGDPTVEDEGPPSLVPEGEEPAQPLSQTTDMGVETWPAPPVIKQEEMDDDDMESQAYDKWIPVTHWANQNITGESDEQERSQSSGGSKELGLDDFKTEPSPLLVSAEDAAPPIKKKYDKRYTCEICGKTENKKARMTSHMRKHTGLPFNCDICGEKFQCQKLLTRHKRFNHYTGIIYSCSVCGKRSCRSHLATRMSVVTLEKTIGAQTVARHSRSARNATHMSVLFTRETGPSAAPSATRTLKGSTISKNTSWKNTLKWWSRLSNLNLSPTTLRTNRVSLSLRVLRHPHISPVTYVE
ncbi:hypermethylated in cancer 1 protein-like isoform X3 [Oncorhynchus keta]|uniref:hypermethylated in cancer 1 protein-like isoform X3 n=1 Tax=Oncorhynchus keta TaxID=8018 RepID=UPI00227D44F3|nr:hypermethylated in cancer 1 protein-like isoform X3 [Oncorhynchus keta]